MDATIRRELKRRILDQSSDFGIEKVLHPSFVRQVTETLQVSASDAAYAIAALLEYPHHLNAMNEESAGSMKKAAKSNNNDVNSRDFAYKKAQEKL